MAVGVILCNGAGGGGGEAWDLDGSVGEVVLYGCFVFLGFAGILRFCYWLKLYMRRKGAYLIRSIASDGTDG